MVLGLPVGPFPLLAVFCYVKKTSQDQPLIPLTGDPRAFILASKCCGVKWSLEGV